MGYRVKSITQVKEQHGKGKTMLNGIVKIGADGENVLYSVVNIRKEAVK